MRHTIILLFLLPALLFFACKNDPKTTASGETNQALDISKPTQDTVKMPEVSTLGAGTYDITEGVMYWSGKKGNDMYSTEIKISGGELLVNKGFILNGKIILDAASLSVLGEMDAGEKQKFESILKAKDYLNTAKYPKMEYIIEGALPSSIPAFNTVLEGKLKIKEVANIINLPAKVTFSGNICTFESVTFALNYAKWNMMMPGDKPRPATNPKPESTDKSATARPSGTVIGSDGISLMMNFKAKARG